jgi:DNA-binding NarL/FixJ family response regulator
LAIGRATGQGDVFPLIFPMLGMALWVRGRMAESGDLLDGAVEAARLLDNVQGLAWNLLNRAMAASAAGDVELALATAEESTELAKDLDEGPVSAYAAVALAGALLDNGRPGPAADALLESAGGEELSLLPGTWRVWSLELLTRCLLEAGRREEAERVAAAATAGAAGALPMAAAMANRAVAVLALDAGDPTRAAERALAAAVALDEVGDVFDAALSRALAGRALAQAGKHDRAAAELERAAAAFGSFGCRRRRAETERELRKLGRPVHRRTAAGKADGTGVDALTERELQVAQLVVDRKTNREIAEALFLSPKTVESHLRNMFGKLEVSSRVEVARVVERADRVERAPA